MQVHQQDQNANELWTYFQNVINWVNLTFPNYRKEMKGVAWGRCITALGMIISILRSLRRAYRH